MLARKVDDQLGEDVHDDVVGVRERPSRKATRSSTGNNVCLWSGSRMTPTTTRSKIRPRDG